MQHIYKNKVFIVKILNKQCIEKKFQRYGNQLFKQILLSLTNRLGSIVYR